MPSVRPPKAVARPRVVVLRAPGRTRLLVPLAKGIVLLVLMDVVFMNTIFRSGLLLGVCRFALGVV
jgi:hypothetical protein